MKLSCYKVKVKTINSTNNKTRSTWQLSQDYLDCENGVVYVTTSDPKTIYDTFEDIISVKLIGIGYNIDID